MEPNEKIAKLENESQNKEASENVENVNTKSEQPKEPETIYKEENINTQNNESYFFNSLVDHKELTHTIWGDEIKQDNFERWSQGFIFDSKEPTALLQFNGGPCAVIAAVQAFLLKELIFSGSDNWRKPNVNKLNNHLTDSLLSIFINVSSDNPKFLVFYENEEEKKLKTDNSEETHSIELEPESCQTKRVKLDYEAFSKKLKVYKFETLNELKIKLNKRISEYKNEYGVLCFLYSLLLTKRLNLLKVELEESGESLIDSLHGHGSQSLTNLMLCGIATSNVFDGDKCLEGLVLHGIPKQSTIGFLTIMEYMRYCEVGWNLKNPTCPIWILASETHLTVFFSKETGLIQNNNENRQDAIKKFQTHDPYDNGFIKTDDLDKLMESLDLLTDKEYVEVVKQQLDSEGLGIITKIAFLNEFFPESEQSSVPSEFEVYHYNGLARSNQENQVQYREGLAKIIDFTDQPNLQVSLIKNCLQTKWPTIEVNWTGGDKAPSLN